MVCASCGEKFDEGTRSCPRCGTPVSEAAETQPQTSFKQTNNRPVPAGKPPAGERKNQPNNGKTSDWIIIMVVCGLYVIMVLKTGWSFSRALELTGVWGWAVDFFCLIVIMQIVTFIKKKIKGS